MKEEKKKFRMRTRTGDVSTVRDKEVSLVSIETGTVRGILASTQRDNRDSWMRDNLSISKIDKGCIMVKGTEDRKEGIIHAAMIRETEERGLVLVRGRGREGRDMEQMVTSRGKAALQGTLMNSLMDCGFYIACLRSRRQTKVSGSVVQDDEEGHLIYKVGDVLQNR